VLLLIRQSLQLVLKVILLSCTLKDNLASLLFSMFLLDHIYTKQTFFQKRLEEKIGDMSNWVGDCGQIVYNIHALSNL